MKNEFQEFYPYSEGELSAFVSNAHVVLDANVLLHIYRYSHDSADRLISILTRISKRLWMPHQVAQEFHANRPKVILDQSKAYDETLKSLEVVRAEAINSLGGSDRHPFIRRQELLRAVTGPIEAEIANVKRLQEEHGTHASRASEVDARWEALTLLYEKRVGTPLDDSAVAILHAEADRRYEQKIPPGFMDAGKSAPEKYGDFVLWSQILSHFEKSKADVVFVTDDQKPDWWRIVSGRTLGAHPLLRREFFNRTGRRIHFYSSDEFVTHFANFLKIDIDEEAREEVERISSTVSATTSLPQPPADYYRTQQEGALSYREHEERQRSSDPARLDSLETLTIKRALLRLSQLREEGDWMEGRLTDTQPGSAWNSYLGDDLLRVRVEEAEVENSLLSLMVAASESATQVPQTQISPVLVREVIDALSAHRKK